MSTVLVTGGTGFVGSHVTARLLSGGHHMRATVRSTSRGDVLRTALTRQGLDTGRLELVQLDLLADDGWSEAMAGCETVHHVASPFPAGEPDDPGVVVRTAVEGTRRVLRAARLQGVRRAVLTSSFAAVGYGPPPDHPFTEDDWTDPAGQSTYVASKTLAERAAWQAADELGLPLTVLNPTGILGPPLTDDLSASVQLVAGLLDGSLSPISDVTFGVVDVRDVADLHLRAAASGRSVGQRFIAVGRSQVSLAEVARILRDGLGDAGAHVSTDEPGVIDPGSPIDGSKARRVLQWSPRPLRETILDTAWSLLSRSR